MPLQNDEGKKTHTNNHSFSSAELIIKKFKRLLLEKNKQKILLFWEEHSLLRAWYQGGLVCFSQEQKKAADWRQISRKDLLSDCLDALVADVIPVYHKLLESSVWQGACPLDKVPDYRSVFLCALRVDKRELAQAIYDEYPDIFSTLMNRYQFTTKEQAKILYKLLMMEMSTEAVLDFKFASHLTNEAFCLYVSALPHADSDLLYCFSRMLITGLSEAVSIMLQTSQLARAIQNISESNRMNLLNDFSDSLLSSDVSIAGILFGMLNKEKENVEPKQNDVNIKKRLRTGEDDYSDGVTDQKKICTEPVAQGWSTYSPGLKFFASSSGCNNFPSTKPRRIHFEPDVATPSL